MKNAFIFALLLASSVSISAFANCDDIVEEASIKIDAANSSTSHEGIYFDAVSELDETDGTTFKYNVYVMSGLANGNPDNESNARNYYVVAVGNADQCSVEQITRLN